MLCVIGWTAEPYLIQKQLIPGQPNRASGLPDFRRILEGRFGRFVGQPVNDEARSVTKHYATSRYLLGRVRRDVLPHELLQEIAGGGAGHREPGIRKGQADAVAVLWGIVEV